MSTGPTLITGAGGFVGRHLIEALRASGREVVGAERPGGPRPEDPDLEWHEADLADAEAVGALIRDTAPAEVVHLAAIAAPPIAARDPLAALRTNTLAVHHLTTALLRSAPDTRLLFVSTGEVYGLAPLGAEPRTEASPLAPPTIYAATKASAEWTVARAEELDAVRVRPFNHTGPGRPESYAESSFSSQLVKMERGQNELVMRVGNLEGVRDFSDVRDIVEAYRTILDCGERGAVYNAASGVGRSIASILEGLIARARVEPRIEVDPERFRPTESGRVALVGAARPLRALGWSPRYDWETTLDDLLESWRGRG